SADSSSEDELSGPARKVRVLSRQRVHAGHDHARVCESGLSGPAARPDRTGNAAAARKSYLHGRQSGPTHGNNTSCTETGFRRASTPDLTSGGDAAAIFAKSDGDCVQPARAILANSTGSDDQQDTLLGTMATSPPRRAVAQHPHLVTRDGGEEIRFADVNLSGPSPAPVTPRRTRLVDRLNPSPIKTGSPHRPSSVTSRSVSASPSKRSCSPSAAPTPRTRPAFLPSDSLDAAAQDVLAAGPKLTYTRNRSYLEDDTDLFNPRPHATLQARQHGGPSPSRDSRQPPLSRALVPRDSYHMQLDADSEDVATGSGTVRNIHELRRAGEAARFESDMDILFEDLDSGIAGQRTTLAELVNRLQDDAFAERFLTHAMEKRLAGVRIQHSDIVCTYLAAAAFALLLSVGTISASAVKICAAPILAAAAPMLGLKDDAATLCRSPHLKVSTVMRASVIEVAGALCRSRIWGDDYTQSVTPELLSLRCIEMVLRRHRAVNEVREALPNHVLEKLVDLVLQHCQSDQSSIHEHESHTLELAVSVLESYTISGGRQSTSSTQHRNLVLRLAGLGAYLARTCTGDDRSSRRRQTRILCIRLILNLTNNDPAICDRFASDELVCALCTIISTSLPRIASQVPLDDIDELIDTAVLALGCAINLAEWCPRVRKVVAETKRGSRSVLDSLILHYRQGKESLAEADNVEKTRSNVVLGYLSLFLCTLCLDDAVRRHLNHAFQGKGLDHLLRTVEEFLQYYRKVEDDLGSGNDMQDSMSTFLARLQTIVDRVRGLDTNP
ncbi:hypothetical protein KEM52_002197, partial [Ascosphaera acerosa]